MHGAWRYVLSAGLLLLVVLIGASRMYMQANFLRDVIAGWIAGLLWSDAVIIGSQLLVTRHRPRPRQRSTPRQRVR